MKIYNKPTTKMLRFVAHPVMLEVSVNASAPIEDPDDENGGLANHHSVWDEE